MWAPWRFAREIVGTRRWRRQRRLAASAAQQSLFRSSAGHSSGGRRARYYHARESFSVSVSVSVCVPECVCVTMPVAASACAQCSIQVLPLSPFFPKSSARVSCRPPFVSKPQPATPTRDSSAFSKHHVSLRPPFHLETGLFILSSPNPEKLAIDTEQPGGIVSM